MGNHRATIHKPAMKKQTINERNEQSMGEIKDKGKIYNQWVKYKINKQDITIN